ncbi:hypothetical protein [Pseudanabaena sp. ABRG5-3]|uniref:hypothetical protein n=1 Tax=Pseudanabaena sp. ABRG5-3 TaxID=685565 RepID=UPI000DC73731|nr:hypothetical protein [Pseudanabaena sp. ABRG5-3]BBC24252.1 hypothetical protein ABRG53_1995 [Pseudanabaena sp. ABRG5-3]
MKYIKKKKEPKSLTDKRNTEGSIYECAQLDWQKQLLNEQGYLCAYCMRPISLERKNEKPCMEIEHYLSRYLCKQRKLDLGLRWQNMLGVCNGISGSEFHCDKTKGNKGKANGKVELNVLNPLNVQTSEEIVTYTPLGQIIPNTHNTALKEKIIEDLNCILNLNNENLRLARKDAMDRAKEFLIKNNPTGTWGVKEIDKEIVNWKSKTKDGRYRAYCQAAIWFLEYLKSKPIHKS